MSTIGSDMAHMSAHQIISLSRGVLSSETHNAASSLDHLAQVLECAGAHELGALLETLLEPVLDPEAGPLSFQALAGINVEHLRGECFWEALTSPHTDPKDLEKLAEFGQSLAGFDNRRITGGVIRVLALLNLARLHAFAPQPPETVQMRAVLRALATAAALPESMRAYASAAADYLGAQADISSTLSPAAGKIDPPA